MQMRFFAFGYNTIFINKIISLSPLVIVSFVLAFASASSLSPSSPVPSEAVSAGSVYRVLLWPHVLPSASPSAVSASGPLWLH